MRRLRGNCGGAFQAGLPLSDTDERGRFIPGYRVAPNCGEFFSDLKVRSCPIADMNRLAPIITAYHRHRKGLLSLTESFKSPSCAIVEAYDILENNTDEMIRRSQEQKLKEINNGTNAS